MGEESPQTPQVKKSAGLTMEQWSLLGSTMTQVGCGTIVVILGALALGLWIDHHFGTRPWATLTLILSSIPVSLWIVGRLAWQAAKEAQRQMGTPPASDASTETDLSPPDEAA